MKLSDICKYRNEKINLKDINENEYVSTDNMLPNFTGLGELKSFPNVDRVSKFCRNDILLSNIRPYFKKMILSDNNSGCSSDVLVIETINKDVNPKFLYYRLRLDDFFDYVILTSKGTKMPRGDKKAIMNFELEVPKLDIQNKIVKIIENIDKKIELNNKINNNLYKISKQLLLKYLDENKSSDEINISKFLNIFTGKKNANETSPTGKYKFFSCAPESLLSDTYLCDSAAIIVAGNGAYTGRTRFYDGKFELYQRTYGLTLKDGFEKNNIYGLYVFMKTIFEPDKMGGTHGSAIPYIVLSDLTDYKLKYNKVEFDRFSNLVSSNIKMIQENEKSNEKLSELRDALLPKLMNSEIDLANIEI